MREHTFEGVIPNLERRAQRTDQPPIRRERWPNRKHPTVPPRKLAMRLREPHAMCAGEDDAYRTLHEISWLAAARDTLVYFQSLELSGALPESPTASSRKLTQPALEQRLAGLASSLNAARTRSRAVKRNVFASTCRFGRSNWRDVRVGRALHRSEISGDNDRLIRHRLNTALI